MKNTNHGVRNETRTIKTNKNETSHRTHTDLIDQERKVKLRWTNNNAGKQPTNESLTRSGLDQTDKRVSKIKVRFANNNNNNNNGFGGNNNNNNNNR